MALKMTLLALPEEILLDILTALFQNAIIGITRPRCHVVKSDYENAIIGIARSRCHRLNIPQPFHRPNILQITVANKKLREMALGLLRDHKSSVSYRVNAIHADYANEPRYWSDTPFFANTINLAIFPSQFAILNKKRLQTSSDPDLRKIVMEWIYHDQNGSSRKYQRPNPGMDQVDFMYQLGTTIREVSARNLAYFLRRARRGNINGIVEVDVKWMGHVECTATVTTARVDVHEAGFASKEMWGDQVAFFCGVLPMYYEQLGTPMGAAELTEYEFWSVAPEWRELDNY